MMKHWGHSPGFEHNLPTGRRSGQRSFDVSRRRWHLRFVNDQIVPINDTYARLFHRDIKSSKIVHGSFSSCDEADPIGLLRRAAKPLPNVEKVENAAKAKFSQKLAGGRFLLRMRSSCEDVAPIAVAP
jgi:hypothetical protein